MNHLHDIYCTHGTTPVLLAKVLDPTSVAYSPTCRKGRNNLPHTVERTLVGA